MVFAAALMVAVGVTAFTQDGSAQPPGRVGGEIAWRLMTDTNGAMLAREAFTKRLDQAIASGIVAPVERESIVQMYDWYQSGNTSGPSAFNRGRFGNGATPGGGRMGGRWGGGSYGWGGNGCGWW